jgi:tRNA threonylcarbamoyladenosine biosynthesis protein TsaE
MLDITYNLKEIDAVARKIVDLLIHDCIIFHAPMGAGKTTLIKSLCKILKIDGEVSSPTFSLVNEYASESREILHFDLYRIDSPDELHEIGMEDYLDRKALKLIEWPDHCIEMLENHHKIKIEIVDEHSRRLTFV